MAINLVKGENINLSKEFSGETKWRLGLSWDLPNNGGKEADLDSFAFCLNDRYENSGKIVSIDHMAAYFNANGANKDKTTFTNEEGGLGFKSIDDCVKLLGDSRDGAEEGIDDEVIDVDLSKADPKTKSILLAVNIYSPKGINFGMVRNSMCKLYKKDSDVPELCYELKEDYSKFNCLVVAELYQRNGEWKIQALGEGETDFEDFLRKIGIPV